MSQNQILPPHLHNVAQIGNQYGALIDLPFPLLFHLNTK